MPIQQGEINVLLNQSVPSGSSDRVFFIEPANLVTATQWFQRITGVRLSLQQLTGRTAAGGFFFYTHNDRIGPNAVNVTIRGGSSSSVSTTREVYTFTSDYRSLSEFSSTSTVPGVATLELTNPRAFDEVPAFAKLDGRVEFKFTQRSQTETSGL